MRYDAVQAGAPAPSVAATVPPLHQVGCGVVVPYDFALDRELWRWTPLPVTLHLTRLPAAEPTVTVEMVTHLGNSSRIVAATRELATVEPRLVAYACTSGSFVEGMDGEARIRGAVRFGGAPRAVTTSGALLEALDALAAHRVAIATPYTADLTVRLAEFLGAAGRTVTGVADLGLAKKIWSLDYEEVAELVRRADRDDAEAVVVSCTNVPTYDIIGPLEAELGKPVVSANQATMWAAFRHMGYRAVGDGQQLLENS